MSSDWFEFVMLANGMAFVHGCNADEQIVCLELGEEEVASVEALEARHHAAMQRLLRDLATVREPKP